MAQFTKSIREVWQEKFHVSSHSGEFFDYDLSSRTLEDGTVVNDLVKTPRKDRYKGLSADMWSVDTLLATGNADMLRSVASVKTSVLSGIDQISSIDPESIVVPKSE